MDKNPSDLKEASDTLHQATQFIAMAGRHFIVGKEDDSHTNADWIASKNWLIGNKIDSPYGAIHVALDYPLLVLILCDEELKPIAELEISGKTRLSVFNWLNNQLWKLGLEVADFEPEMHYDLPDHPVLHGQVFEMNRPKDFLELANYRSNGHAILSEISSGFEDKSELRIWPHHFDDGIILPIKKEHESVLAMISLGLAMPDAYYDQPYFYVNAWTKTGIDYSKAKALQSKGFWHEKDWHGQVLKAEELVFKTDHEEQQAICTAFLEEAIKNALSLL
jgi:hypothetical protein